jgi:hypothetical protein
VATSGKSVVVADPPRRLALLGAKSWGMTGLGFGIAVLLAGLILVVGGTRRGSKPNN